MKANQTLLRDCEDSPQIVISSALLLVAALDCKDGTRGACARPRTVFSAGSVAAYGRRSVRYCVTIGAVVAAVLFWGCQEVIAETTEPDNALDAGAIAKLRKFKTESEEYAAQFQKDYPNGEDQTRRKAQRLYVSAEGSVNGWIEAFKWEVLHGQNRPNSVSYNAAKTAAETDTKAYLDYVNKIYAPGAISVVGTVLVGVAQKIIEDFVGDFITASAKEKDATIAQMDTMRWRSWEEVSTPTKASPTSENPGGK